MCLQATAIHKNSECLREAHIHALVNMLKREIVVMHYHASRLCCSLYTLGYKPQLEMKRSELRNKLAQQEPPLTMFLEAKHFDALVAEVREYNVCEVSD